MGSAVEEGRDESREIRNRGGCLTALLVVTFLMTPLAIWAHLVARHIERSRAPGQLSLDLGNLLLVFAEAADVLFVIAIWRWKKAGVYGYLAVHVALVALALWVGQPGLQIVIADVAPPVLLLFLVSRVGGYFE